MKWMNLSCAAIGIATLLATGANAEPAPSINVADLLRHHALGKEVTLYQDAQRRSPTREVEYIARDYDRDYRHGYENHGYERRAYEPNRYRHIEQEVRRVPAEIHEGRYGHGNYYSQPRHHGHHSPHYSRHYPHSKYYGRDPHYRHHYHHRPCDRPVVVHPVPRPVVVSPAPCYHRPTITFGGPRFSFGIGF